MICHSSHMRALLCGLAAPLVVGASSASATEAIGVLNDTGQVECYTTDYAQVVCDEATAGDESPLPGQDGRYGRDAAAAAGRLVKVGSGEGAFDWTRLCMSGEAEGTGDCPSPPPMPEDVEHPEPNDWACVRDNVTGLTWSLGYVRWDNGILRGATWAEASSTEDDSYIGRANTSARCGLAQGWRLPARREGFSITTAARSYPAANPDYWPILASNMGIGAFYTTDVDADYPLFNRSINFEALMFSGGLCREIVPDTLCASPPPNRDGRWEAGVLLVNGEWQQAPGAKDDRWQFGEDGLVVTDTATGLMWDRCTWGQTGTDCEGDGEVFQVWSDAMQVPVLANQRHHRGYQDWRMPNARELETLVNMDVAHPTIDLMVFPNTPPAFYWTASTAFIGSPVRSRAWNVWFDYGVVSSHPKAPLEGDPIYPDRSRVRLVRDGGDYAPFDGVSEVLFRADFEDVTAKAH